MEYVILTDMSIDIDLSVPGKYEIEYVPMEYSVGTESRKCLCPESNEMMHTYYEKLRQKVETKTSQISPYLYMDVFRPYVDKQIPVLYICLSSGLSNTYDSARMAVNMLKEDFGDVQIEVVDSLGATGGMGLLAECACKNREAGMPLTEAAQWLRDNAGKINYWFKVEDLLYLSRGGRISAASAVLGTALNIKPVLTIKPDGKLDTVAKKRGDKQAVKFILEQFDRNFDETMGKSVYICCADCMDAAQKLKEQVQERRPDLEVHITMLSPIIGAHTGPDMLALIYFGTDRQ